MLSFLAAVLSLTALGVAQDDTTNGRITDTTNSTFYLNVNGAANYAGRNLQLRPIADDPANTQDVVIDASSPVLLATLQDGTLFQATRNGNTYKMGPLAYLLNTTAYGTVAGTSVQEFQFRYSAGNGQYVNTLDGWYLEPYDNQGTYALYHDVSTGFNKDFMLCDEGAGFAVLAYRQYTGTAPAAFANCTTIQLLTTLTSGAISGVPSVAPTTTARPTTTPRATTTARGTTYSTTRPRPTTTSPPRVTTTTRRPRPTTTAWGDDGGDDGGYGGGYGGDDGDDGGWGGYGGGDDGGYGGGWGKAAQ